MANQYFAHQPYPENIFTIVAADTRHHLFHVMRLVKGDKVEMVFSDGQAGEVRVIDPERATFELVQKLNHQTELPLDITVAVGIPKGDKLDVISEKVTELGAARIWAAPFERSVAKWDKLKQKKKSEKIQKIILSAAEQSKRLIIPQILLFESLSNLTERFSEFDQVLVAYEEVAKVGEHTQLLQSLSKKPQKILMLFGPEGGISSREIEKFQAAGAVTFGLGPRILRAETAPIAALSAIGAYYELFD